MKYSNQQALAEEIQASVNKALFGTVHFGKLYASLMVMMSLIVAMFIPHEGLFATSQSTGMTNYHRWLYDVYVISSCITGVVIFLRLQHKKHDVKFRRLWHCATKISAEERFREYQYAQSQSKVTILYSSKILFYAVLLGFTVGVIAMYVWMTPFAGTYKSSFWILAWWPINALIIWALYCCQSYLFLRLFSTEDMHKHFLKLKREAQRQAKKSMLQKDSSEEQV